MKLATDGGDLERAPLLRRSNALERLMEIRLMLECGVRIPVSIHSSVWNACLFPSGYGISGCSRLGTMKRGILDNEVHEI